MWQLARAKRWKQRGLLYLLSLSTDFGASPNDRSRSFYLSKRIAIALPHHPHPFSLPPSLCISPLLCCVGLSSPICSIAFAFHRRTLELTVAEMAEHSWPSDAEVHTICSLNPSFLLFSLPFAHCVVNIAVPIWFTLLHYALSTCFWFDLALVSSQLEYSDGNWYLIYYYLFFWRYFRILLHLRRCQ